MTRPSVLKKIIGPTPSGKFRYLLSDVSEIPQKLIPDLLAQNIGREVSYIIRLPTWELVTEFRLRTSSQYWSIMPEIGKEKEIAPKPLPKYLQRLVDKDEADKQIRGDYENSWTTT